MVVDVPEAARIWPKRGNDRDRKYGAKKGRRQRAASWHRSALYAVAWPYANVSYANEAPSAAGDS